LTINLEVASKLFDLNGGKQAMDRTLLREWQKKQWAPIYLFYGEESFLIEESIRYLQKQMGLETDSWGRQIFDLNETPLQQVIEEAETAPFLAEYRLVVAKNAYFLTGKKGKNKVTHEVEALLRYLESPLASSVLILVVPEKQLDRRKKIVKALQKQARVVEFAALSERESLQWIQKRCRQKGVEITAAASQQLLTQVGPDLERLHQECVKCATYVGTEGVINEELITQLVPRTLEQNVFQLVSKMAERRIDQVLHIWHDLLLQKEEPIRIMALIIRQLRLMLYVKWLHGQQWSEQAIAKRLDSHPYPVKLAVRQGRAFRESELRTLFLGALQADEKMKSENCDRQLVVEQLFFQLDSLYKTKGSLAAEYGKMRR
jgi:DNA polymerase-3 subunit delta